MDLSKVCQSSQVAAMADAFLENRESRLDFLSHVWSVASVDTVHVSYVAWDTFKIGGIFNNFSKKYRCFSCHQLDAKTARRRPAYP